MRILHIISSPAAGGAEVYVKDLAKALVKRGDEVFIGFLDHASDIGRSEDYEKQFLAELDEANIKYFFIGNSARRLPWLGMIRVFKYVRRNKIDVYHSHLSFGVFFGALLSLPKVYTHHNVRPRFKRIIYRIFNFGVTEYVGISDICVKSLKACTGRNVTSILNGVDSEKFCVRERNLGVDNVIKAIAVGRISPQKDYFFLADIVKSLPEDVRRRIEITIAGEGDPEYVASFHAHLKSLGVSKFFNLLGNRSDIVELLDHSDLFVMSSEWEGLPISLIEASVAGLPCVVTDVGGCREVVEHCQNGFFIPHGDIQKYSTALAKIISDPSLLRQFSLNAIRHASKFSIDNCCEEHQDLYRRVLENVH